ncbi:MAG: hypothetical protein Q8K30_04080 [Candidatus Gracilibacteria bacterium]|nr:hypothetical protein [Candidatus Gracilibacteria bacterium]
MFKKIVFFIFLFFSYTLSYSYEFDDNAIKNYMGDYKFYNYYNIDNLRFMVQAPLKTKENWDKHNESCEEAALFLAHTNINNIYFDINSADVEFQNMNDYEETKMGIIKDKKHNINSSIIYLRDIHIDKMHELAIGYYGYSNKNSHIINNPSLETLRYLISHDYILIVPSNTLTLGNPNFNQSTNSYHVIDLIGYDINNFVSLDPGTSKGANYKYSNSIIMKGIRENGDKILVLEGKMNQNNIDFQQIYFNEKSKLFLRKLDEIIEENPKNKKNILKIISQKLSYKSKNTDEKLSQLLTKLVISLDNKFDELAFDRNGKLID